MQEFQPGWYIDPQGAPGLYRYWDGDSWTEETLQLDQPSNVRSKGRLALFAIAAIAVVGLVIAGFFAALTLGVSSSPEAHEGSDSNTEEPIDLFEWESNDRFVERVEELPDIQLDSSLNTDISMQDGASEADFNFENPASSEYDVVFNITLDNGRNVYISGPVKPDYHIESARMDNDGASEKGTYEAIATMVAFEPGSDVPVGKQSLPVTITVLN